MEIKSILKSITEELAECYAAMDEEQIQEWERRIKKANRIYVAGAGRSLLMIRGFAMRLMHMGFVSYVVGETVTPAIAPGDLLIIASGSGKAVRRSSTLEKSLFYYAIRLENGNALRVSKELPMFFSLCFPPVSLFCYSLCVSCLLIYFSGW